MTTLLAALIVFGVLITVHELGHFAAAKLVGMQVDEFAIGFGPKLYQTEEKSTVYTLRALPLGGFNRIAGMEPGEENVENGFHTKPLWARMVVILAGVTMNFLLPLLLSSESSFSMGQRPRSMNPSWAALWIISLPAMPD